MGEVFLAEDTSLGRRAALKFLAAEFASDEEHRARFVREARSASALNHPNICTIYEINESGDVPFIAMEFIDGETIAAMVRRRRRNVKQTIDLAIQIAEALADAHANGIVHRDIKPANIVVNRRGQVKILDFGLAKKTVSTDADATRQQLTNAGVVLGTASYMSPEQARGLPVDGRTDIWSFGVCVYEMLTGKQPFTGNTTTDTFAAILTSEPVPPSRHFTEIPAELDRLVLTAIQKPLSRRYESFEAIVSDLTKMRTRVFAADDLPDSAAEISISDEQTEEFDASTDYDVPRITDEDLRKRNTRPNNLTGTFSQIIGREDEIVSISKLLQADNTRLLTMTGIGGTGKTRLSRAVAERLLPEFEDGVFFIEMADITQPEVVAATIAQPLGVKEEGEKPAMELLKDHLRDKQMLLVIDNFEQIVSAAPLLHELSVSSRGLKMMVTSREVLRLSNETEFPVPPLDVPKNAASLSYQQLRTNEAVLLFSERARIARPSFLLTPVNASDVAAICARLDGLPLAIELAAARVKVLTPAAILSKLENRLNLLTGGSRDLPERQQTMRAAVAWSYDLLSELEKAVFHGFSVFAGGCRIEAAEAVCGSGDMEVLNAVTSLIDKNILVQKELRDGESRFRMLEVVRDFAAEMLSSSGDAGAIARKHAEYFVALGETAEPFLQTAESEIWLARLEEEHDNIRAAMKWCLEHDPPLGTRLAIAVRNYWLVHGHLTEGFGWLKAAAESGSEIDPAMRFKLLNGFGLAARFRGDYETARKAYEDGLAAGRDAGDKPGIALSNRGLGLVAMQQNDLAAAATYFDEGLSISRDLQDDFGVAISLSFLGDLARTEGRYDDALPYFEEAIELFEKLDKRPALADALNNLGAAVFSTGQPDAAKAHFSKALGLAEGLNNRITVSFSLDGFAAVATSFGDTQRAARLSGAAENLRDLIGYKIEPAERRFRETYLTRLRDQMPGEEFLSLYGDGRSLNLDQAIVAALELGSSKPSEDLAKNA